jgi:hypothetical protein
MFRYFGKTVKGKKKKCKAIPVTGREGPRGCETSRLSHFLDNRLTDGDEVLSLTRRTPELLSFSAILTEVTGSASLLVKDVLVYR